MNRYQWVHVVAIIFVIITGTLLHFTWEWSNYNIIIALFSSVNESTWEHLKLLFFPFLAFSIIEHFIYGREIPCFWNTKLRSVILGMGSIPILFYTYTGILGKHYLLLDIATFVLSVIITYVFSYNTLFVEQKVCKSNNEELALFYLIIIVILFGVFTFFPPSFGIFLSGT